MLFSQNNYSAIVAIATIERVSVHIRSLIGVYYTTTALLNHQNLLPQFCKQASITTYEKWAFNSS